LYLIGQFKPDVAILEVGLGGRLDAVNIIDADLAHLTPIGLDHQDWLGDTVDLIAYEKAGILRDKGLAVCNMLKPADSLLSEFTRHKSQVSALAQDYNFQVLSKGYLEWSNDKISVKVRLPLPGWHQALNISGVLEGLFLLGFLDSRSEQQIVSNFDGVSCPGRLQKIETGLAFQLWLDVGHNEDAAAALALALGELEVKGRIVVLLGMLSDKNPAGFVAKLKPVVDEWWGLGLSCDRGLSAEQLSERLADVVSLDKMFNSSQQVIQQAVLNLNNQDILLVCGSFMTAQVILDVV